MLRQTQARAPMRIPLNTLHLPIPTDQRIRAGIARECHINLVACHNARQLLTGFANLLREV
jgi:hypothetical protein